jgi:hypothetical protein
MVRRLTQTPLQSRAYQPQSKARIKFSAVVRAATGETCNSASYPLYAMKMDLAIWTFVEVPPSACARRERKIMTALLICNSQIVARCAPLVAMRQNSATTSSKLSENMRQFMAQCAIDFRRMFEQPRI